MTLPALTPDLTRSLIEAAQVLIPRLPSLSQAPELRVLTSEELFIERESGEFVTVGGRVSGAVTGEVVLCVRPDANPSGDAPDEPEIDVVSVWGPVLSDVVAAVGRETGQLQLQGIRRLETLTALPAPGATQHAVAVVAGPQAVALLALTCAPDWSVPEPRTVPASALDASRQPVDPRRLHLLRDVVMGLSVELGRTRMTVRELLSLTPGTIVQLDRAAGSPVDLLVNGTLIARGEVVVVDEEFAVRVSEIVGPDLEDRLGA
jgi:flagellar motor switch protein FliN/FliY